MHFTDWVGKSIIRQWLDAWHINSLGRIHISVSCRHSPTSWWSPSWAAAGWATSRTAANPRGNRSRWRAGFPIWTWKIIFNHIYNTVNSYCRIKFAMFCLYAYWLQTIKKKNIHFFSLLHYGGFLPFWWICLVAPRYRPHEREVFNWIFIVYYFAPQIIILPSSHIDRIKGWLRQRSSTLSLFLKLIYA